MFENRFALLFVLAGLGWLCLCVDARRRHHAEDGFKENEAGGEHDFWWQDSERTRRPRKLARFSDPQSESAGHSDRPKLSQLTNQASFNCDSYFYSCKSRDGELLGEICVDFVKELGSFPPRCVENVRHQTELVYRCRKQRDSQTFEVERTNVKC